MTIAERLGEIELSSVSNEKGASKGTASLQTDNFAVLLVQGLESNDASILNVSVLKDCFPSSKILISKVGKSKYTFSQNKLKIQSPPLKFECLYFQRHKLINIFKIKPVKFSSFRCKYEHLIKIYQSIATFFSPSPPTESFSDSQRDGD